MTADARVLLVGKPGCHLCDDARVVVAAVCASLGIPWREVSILADPGLADRYADLIPVVLVDGVEVAAWRVDAGSLERALGASDR